MLKKYLLLPWIFPVTTVHVLLRLWIFRPFQLSECPPFCIRHVSHVSAAILKFSAVKCSSCHFEFLIGTNLKFPTAPCFSRHYEFWNSKQPHVSVAILKFSLACILKSLTATCFSRHEKKILVCILRISTATSFRRHFKFHLLPHVLAAILNIICYHVFQPPFQISSATTCLFARWYAKRIDHSTPLFNDSIQYRREYEYYYNISNIYRANLYNNRYKNPPLVLQVFFKNFCFCNKHIFLSEMAGQQETWLW